MHGPAAGHIQGFGQKPQVLARVIINPHDKLEEHVKVAYKYLCLHFNSALQCLLFRVCMKTKISSDLFV